MIKRESEYIYIFLYIIEREREVHIAKFIMRGKKGVGQIQKIFSWDES